MESPSVDNGKKRLPTREATAPDEALSVAASVFLASESTNDSTANPGLQSAAAETDLQGWWWCAEWSRYMHTAAQCSFDPQTQTYSRWDEAAGAWCDFATPESYQTSLDLEKPPDIPDCGLDEDTSGNADGSCSSSEEEGDTKCDGDPGESDAIVCGDWIWDGEFWVTADGISYHPGLGQYFSHGQRVFLREEDKPCPDDKVLYDRWLADRYVLDYGVQHASSKPEAVNGHTNSTTQEDCTDAQAETGHHRQKATIGISGASLGRSRSCTVFLKCVTLSKSHAAIVWDATEQRFQVRDCGSRRGTFLNGDKVTECAVPLNLSDELRLGQSAVLEVTSIREQSQPELQLEWALKGFRRKRPEKRRQKTELGEHDDLVEEARNQYRDRAKERRQLHGGTELATMRTEYAQRVSQLQKQREDVRNRLQPPAHQPPSPGGVVLPSARPAADAEWRERGMKMLKKMGWEEGSGLGRGADGRVEPITALGNERRAGVGLAEPRGEGGGSVVPAGGVGRMVAKSKLARTDEG